jgi:hypothetical protein
VTILGYKRDTFKMNSKALTQRSLDFWLLGGFSIAAWAALSMFQIFREQNGYINNYFTQLAATAAMLAYVCNYPHFLASYRLAYSRGLPFIKKNNFQLIIVPILLIAIILLAFGFYTLPVEQNQTWISILSSLKSTGLDFSFLDNPKLGELIVGNMVNLMYLTVGWHYTKQTFGCVMVYSNFDNYKLTSLQKNLIRYNLLGVWWLTFAHSNMYGGANQFWQIPYTAFNLPDWLYTLTNAYFVVSILTVAYFVFYKNYKQNKIWPTANMLVPMAAMYIWWLPVTRQYDFYMYLTPFFHSLQYLAFVYKIEGQAAYEKQKNSTYITLLIFGLIITGWFSFDALPNAIDKSVGSLALLGVPFFLAAVTLFINIHHYFIDNVIWRFSDPKIREQLLK